MPIRYHTLKARNCMPRLDVKVLGKPWKQM